MFGLKMMGDVKKKMEALKPGDEKGELLGKKVKVKKDMCMFFLICSISFY